MKPTASVCVVTEQKDRIETFVRAHLPAFVSHGVELLVFASEELTPYVRER